MFASGLSTGGNAAPRSDDDIVPCVPYAQTAGSDIAISPPAGAVNPPMVIKAPNSPGPGWAGLRRHSGHGQSSGRPRSRFVSPRFFFSWMRRCCDPLEGLVGTRGGPGALPCHLRQVDKGHRSIIPAAPDEAPGSDPPV
jgi:hypothetical protein